ncbi:hypothetical protein [Rubrolithibacter danxiaensis]|uniref:hypothetical protein n=1 Tax=Rubrolithibacter danxiaensis TaxID=3390805 RepID=UPI003BF8F8A6
MNQQTVQSIISTCGQFENVNYEDLVSRVYPDRTDLENIQLSQLSLGEFIYLTKRIVPQFVAAVNDREIAMILPLVYNHGQFGNAQVDTQLQNLLNYTNQANFPSAEQFLLWLVNYQVENGIYSKTGKKPSETLSASLNALAEKLNLTQQSISNKQKEVEALYKSLETSNKEIQNLITQKREELNQITTNLTTSNSQASQIAELLNRATEQNSRLNSILEQQEQNKQQSDKKFKDLQGTYSETNAKLDENIKTILSQIDVFNQQVTTNQGHLEFVESKKEFFDERIKYLENLIGREVGASLFETFKQRKVELHKSVDFWRWAVPVMAVATIIWIFFLFSRQTDIHEINLWWQAFAVNTLKSIPAIFLLLFAINQYRKERNFQEEYAFKSAVALTIDAYSSRLNDLTNKDKLIMEAVLSVYKTPIEERLAEKIKTKTAMETMKTMVDTTRELVKGK